MNKHRLKRRKKSRSQRTTNKRKKRKRRKREIYMSKARWTYETRVGWQTYSERRKEEGKKRHGVTHKKKKK
jgi:hypothetical protein